VREGGHREGGGAPQVGISVADAAGCRKRIGPDVGSRRDMEERLHGDPLIRLLVLFFLPLLVGPLLWRWLLLPPLRVRLR